MTKPRYRVKKWNELRSGDVVVLFSFRILPVHYVCLGNQRPHSLYIGEIEYDFKQADDVVIKRTAWGLPDEDCYVLAPEFHAGIVSPLTEEQRWEQIRDAWEREFAADNIIPSIMRLFKEHKS